MRRHRQGHGGKQMSAKPIGEVKDMVRGWLAQRAAGHYVDFTERARVHWMDVERLCSVSINARDAEAGRLYDEFCEILGRQTLFAFGQQSLAQSSYTEAR